MLRGLARPLAAVAFTSFVLFTLAGCTWPSAAADDPGDGAATTVDRAPMPVDIPDGVVATGELVGADGTYFGEVYIERWPGTYTLYLPGNSYQRREGVIVGFSDSPFAIDGCGDANIWQIGTGLDPQSLAPAIDIGFIGQEFPDPSFFTSVVIVQTNAEQPNGCWQPILAMAPLEWDVPNTHPWVDPVDSGAADAANGVAFGVDGRRLYRTAAGDTWNAIAERFGITAEELTWLNPIRTPGERSTAYADQVLNLDPNNRGDSESRRPQ